MSVGNDERIVPFLFVLIDVRAVGFADDTVLPEFIKALRCVVETFHIADNEVVLADFAYSVGAADVDVVLIRRSEERRLLPALL